MGSGSGLVHALSSYTRLGQQACAEQFDARSSIHTRQPGDAEVAEVGPHGQVSVVMSDDGDTRTWTLQFLLNTCTDVAQLNIYSVGSSGTTNGVRSNPLHAWLLRDQAEVAALVGCP
jgi:hypothetical protein